MDPNEQQMLEKGFQEGLEDVVLILSKLGPFCKDLSHAINICQLALKNKDQLHFLLRLTKS